MPLYSINNGTTFTFRSPRNGPTYTGGNNNLPIMYGPTQSELQAYYNTNDATLASLLTTNTYFKVPFDGYQWWQVPATGTYRIVAHGGPGGPTSATGRNGSKLTATFALTEGEIIWIAVGQSGSNGNATGADWCSSGGGGATVVAKAPSTGGTVLSNITNCLLMAAGGKGPREARFSPATPTASSSANGTSGAGFTSFKGQSFNGAAGGYGGYIAYGGFGGGSASDDSEGNAGGYDGLYSAGPNSFVDASGTDVNRVDTGEVGYSLPGYVTITAVAVTTTPSAGLSANSQSVGSGETLTVTLTTTEVADNTLVPYTITGVNSGDINGASLTGNFTVVNNTASVSFLISTSTKKTLTLTSNGFTQTVSLLENRYGLVVLNETASITSTFRDLPIVNLTSVGNLTTINVLNIDNQFKFSFNQDSVIKYTSANDYNLINLSSSTSNLLSITILTPGEQAKYNLAESSSVILALRSFITIDFASRTSFNTSEVIDFDPPQYWIGA